jgi:aspartyl/asparaginyl-tRNA synthetase
MMSAEYSRLIQQDLKHLEERLMKNEEMSTAEIKDGISFLIRTIKYAEGKNSEVYSQALRLLKSYWEKLPPSEIKNGIVKISDTTFLGKGENGTFVVYEVIND